MFSATKTAGPKTQTIIKYLDNSTQKTNYRQLTIIPQ